MKEFVVRDATDIASECYREMGKYAAETRVYASTLDGFKTGQRRLIYASSQFNGLTKSAVLVGQTLRYHPHGNDSTYGTLVSMACKYGRFPLFDTQGNFGGLGSRSASMRYTGAKLSDLARLMTMSLVDYSEFQEGDIGYMEPKRLPSLLPYAFLTGSGGIPIGLPGAVIPQVDSLQLVDYFVSKLKGEEGIVPLPDFGGCIINQSIESAREVIKTGQGKLWFRGLITEEEEGKFVITDGTPKKGVSNVITALKWYIDNDIVDYTDESGSSARYVFEIYDRSKITPQELKDKIDKALKCSVTYKYIFVDTDETAVYCDLDYVVNSMIKYLKECTVRKYKDYLSKSDERYEILQIIKEFKESGKISEMSTMTQEDVATFMTTLGSGHDYKLCYKTTGKPMSYLTRSHDEEMEDIKRDINKYRMYIEKPEEYLLELYAELRAKVSEMYETKSHSIIGDIEEIQSREYFVVLEGSRAEVVVEDSENAVKLKSRVISVQRDGNLDVRPAPKVPGSVIEFGYESLGLVSDMDKYVVILDKSRTHIVVHKLKDIRNKWKFCNEDYDFVRTYNKEVIEIVSSKGEKWDMELKNWCRQRTGKSYKIGKVVRIEGEKI